MIKTLFIITILIILFGCGKKSVPVYKSEKQINNIIIMYTSKSFKLIFNNSILKRFSKPSTKLIYSFNVVVE